jgi:hypothetical protein
LIDCRKNNRLLETRNIPVEMINEFGQRYRLQVQRDSGDNTPIIRGRKGKSHLFDYGEGILGVLVMPEAGTAHWWNAARAAFVRAGMDITQAGDQEGGATFEPEKPAQVRLALKYADVKARRRVSEAERERLIRIGFKRPLPTVLPVSQSDFANTVEGEKTL